MVATQYGAEGPSVRKRTLAYRMPALDGPPPPGVILMGEGPRIRRAYRILSATKVQSHLVGLGTVTWKLAVEPMSAAAGREEIDAGTPWWTIRWDKREKRRLSPR